MTPPPLPAEPLNRDELLADFKKLLRELMGEVHPDEGPKKGNGHDGQEIWPRAVGVFSSKREHPYGLPSKDKENILKSSCGSTRFLQGFTPS